MVSLGSVLSATLVADSVIGGAVGLIAVLGAGCRHRRADGRGHRVPPPAGDHRHARLLVHRRGWRCWSCRGPAARCRRRCPRRWPATCRRPLLMLILLVIAWRLFAATPAGLAITAAGDNPAGAFRSGVRVPLAQIGAYAIAGGPQRLRRVLSSPPRPAPAIR